MDVRSGRAEASGHGGGQGGPSVFARNAGARRLPISERIGQVLGEWQARELRVARGFAECRGLSTEQLEDIYQDTALALYLRPYHDEEHLRNALRTGIKHRALRLHRDERRRGQILAHSALGLRLMAQATEAQRAPEPATLAKEDRLIALEFKTELTEDEQLVFGWLVEGLQYRAVASVLEIPESEARNTARSCERKLKFFQTLYEAGRLCGYRAQTILALQKGEATSEVLAERALAHLERCAHCRAEHKTNARRLRRSFREQAAALLPPVFVGHLGWLTRLGLRARTLQHSLATDGVPLGQGDVRERAAAMLAGGGISAKVGVGVVTVGVLAGGAVATHVLGHPSAAHRHRAAPSQVAAAPLATAPVARLLSASSVPSLRASVDRSLHVPRHPHHSTHRREPASTRRVNGPSAAGQREPGGFAYLGVPTSAPVSGPEPAHTAAQRGGGPFSP
jgi:RNA polymerase sigma factor (sigma-70 family)